MRLEYQVIRDIGIRKTLEGQLRESLGKVRKMENMTILALAKISEYRDASPYRLGWSLLLPFRK